MSDFAGVVSLKGQPIEPDWQHALLVPFRGRLHEVHAGTAVLLFQVEHASDASTRIRPRPVVASLEALRIVGDLRVDHIVGRETLPKSGRAAEQILSLCADDPSGFPDRITGDFAAAIWDESRSTLVAVRDHFGVHPFYYVWQDGLLFFSSDIRSLTAIGPYCRELDLLRVAQFLEGEPTEEDRTFYRAIKRLPRASQLHASADGLSVRPYWSTADISEAVLTDSEEHLVLQLRDVFCDAVASRLGSDEVLGTLLSGGLDSSSVTCTARELMDPARSLRALSAVFPSLADPYRSQIDESMYVDAVCEIDGISSHRVEADWLTPLSGLAEILSIHGQPVDPPNAYLDLAMCRLASEHGIEILLDGLEGDITISHGVHYLDELAERKQWRQLLREGEKLDDRLGLNRDAVFRRYGLQHLAFADPSGFLKGVSALVLSGRFRMAASAARSRFRGRAPAEQSGGRTLISTDLAHELDWASRSHDSGPNTYPTERAAHEAFLNKAYIPSIMEFTHANGRHFGIDVRHPMFDRRVVELAVRMPPTLKLKDGWTRYVLRAAMSGIVPDTVRWRPGKATLAPNFDLKMSHEAAGEAKAILSESESLMRDFVDLTRMQGHLDRNRHRAVWPAIVMASFLSKKIRED